MGKTCVQTQEDLSFFSNWKTWRSLIVPGFLGGTVPLKSGWIRAMLVLGIPIYEIAYSLGRMRGGLGGVILEDDPQRAPGTVGTYNDNTVRNIEIPSANGHASARALATLAAAMAEGGEINGVRLLSRGATERAQMGGVVDSMGLGGRLTNGDFRKNNTFTNAGWNQFQELPRGSGRDGWTGWLGIGGSVLQWTTSVVGCIGAQQQQRQQPRIGFGFCGNHMHLVPTNERAAKLQHVTKVCATKLASSKL